MKLALLSMLLLISVASNAISEEWVRILDPKDVRVAISLTKKVVEIETWKLRGHNNFVNLSFWGNRGPVGCLVIDSISHGVGKRTWPVMSLDPYIGEYTSGPMKTGFAGSNVLVRGGKEVKQRRSFFTRRSCPRTGIGHLPDGRIIVIVTTSSNMRDFARKFVENGATFAINVDGGSSTMFIENGVSLWNSKRSAVPVILSW